VLINNLVSVNDIFPPENYVLSRRRGAGGAVLQCKWGRETVCRGREMGFEGGGRKRGGRW
jgi:hypothetical protein